MMTRTLSRLIAATFAALPLASHADANDKALETCTQAFIEHLSSTHGKANYRVEKPVRPATAPSTITAYHNRRHIDLALSAKVVRSGEVIARATCTATASGELIAMKSLRLDAPKGLLLSARETQ